MNCKKCVYCVQDMRHTIKIICRNKTFLQKLGLFNDCEKIDEPCYCTFYTTKKQYIKQEINKL